MLFNIIFYKDSNNIALIKIQVVKYYLPGCVNPKARHRNAFKKIREKVALFGFWGLLWISLVYSLS